MQEQKKMYCLTIPLPINYTWIEMIPFEDLKQKHFDSPYPLPLVMSTHLPQGVPSLLTN